MSEAMSKMKLENEAERKKLEEFMKAQSEDRSRHDREERNRDKGVDHEKERDKWDKSEERDRLAREKREREERERKEREEEEKRQEEERKKKEQEEKEKREQKAREEAARKVRKEREAKKLREELERKERERLRKEREEWDQSWTNYQAQWVKFKASKPRPLTLRQSIPWPVKSGAYGDVAASSVKEFMVMAVPRNGDIAKLMRKECQKWHPDMVDKWLQGTKISEVDRYMLDMICRVVTEVLNKTAGRASDLVD
jgi:hypothetical protein